MFLVRARNSHGLSLPSPVSDVLSTRGLFIVSRMPVATDTSCINNNNIIIIVNV